MKSEIERRFLLDKLPFEINDKYLIEQIYLPLNRINIKEKGIFFDENKLIKDTNLSYLIPLFSNEKNNLSCRIRKLKNLNFSKYIFTIKIRDAPGIRREIEWELTKEVENLFSFGLPKISKIRYEYLDDVGLWEIDEFLDNNLGLFIAEIELESLDKEINLPKWIGKEITGEIKYLNSTLATNLKTNI